jgi:hypothetical protein
MMKLPATFLEAEAIAVVEHWVDVLQDKLTTEASRSHLRAYIREQIQKGAIPTIRVIEAADHGEPDCDRALRELIIEMVNRDELPPVLLRAYMAKALLRCPASYPRGSYFLDTWHRDIGIAVLVLFTAQIWGLEINRNVASTDWPSACSVVAHALTNRGHKISEKTVGTIYRERNKIAEKLAASIQL